MPKHGHFAVAPGPHPVNLRLLAEHFTKVPAEKATWSTSQWTPGPRAGNSRPRDQSFESEKDHAAYVALLDLCHSLRILDRCLARVIAKDKKGHGAANLVHCAIHARRHTERADGKGETDTERAAEAAAHVEDTLSGLVREEWEHGGGYVVVVDGPFLSSDPDRTAQGEPEPSGKRYLRSTSSRTAPT